ncbi:ADP-forming succinate--CoA ligase subunit beta [Lacrimispora sp. NSJ-141]|uniref:Succinate--CoA ligase [ADP-forming] subunit beta n=1 Tax=Lientehia hominis TaxID=2897778 RepID=A0AAP2RJR6_9FIRM|nr:ADP-forming succinate--CoA ligase subunit beta [Lientehia hominis]MCD2492165.1 ADP-forming succinate--CoA ligase subunit beta [Lientehia hominis]
MKIHEYQAKELLAQYGVPVPEGVLLSEKDTIPDEIRFPCVIKAQIHSGGRGKAGGVRLVNSADELKKAAGELFGTCLVTRQTGPKGRTVHKLLLTPAERIKKEYYLGLLPDFENGGLLILASACGGMEIEQIAEEQPDLIFKQPVSLQIGLRDYHVRVLTEKLGMSSSLFCQMRTILKGMFRLFLEKDCSMAEINPLSETEDGRIHITDAKITFDDNGCAGHPELMSLMDPFEEDEKELKAREAGLNYISLSGTIGCMVNGAGLAMATMDMLEGYGGRPANFLDVGGSATEGRIKKAFEILLSDERVRVILVNIFGGIIRCDIAARGILGAAEDLGVKIPVIVRLEGTYAEEGRRLLRESGLSVIPAENMSAAAKKAVEYGGESD